MRERTIKITVSFDMTDFPEEYITPAHKVWDMVMRGMSKQFAWDEGFRDIQVEVIDE